MHEEEAIALLASDTWSLQNALGPYILYIPPVSKRCIVTHLIFGPPSTTCLAAVDIDIGSPGTAADSWWNALTLATLIDTTDGCMVVRGPEVQEAQQQIFAAGDPVTMTINTGAVGAANTRVDVYGYLYDA